MTVRLDHRAIHLEGNCHVEDAEHLLELLQEQQGRPVDISALDSIHTAVLQLLLAFRPKVAGSNGDSFFESWIAPLLVTADNE
jgi:ABC-type transporter Mla MlaB component